VQRQAERINDKLSLYFESEYHAALLSDVNYLPQHLLDK
jgi:hypothetical protein